MELKKWSIELYLWAIFYFLLTLLLRWQFNLSPQILFYLAGGIIGLHLVEVIESLLKVPASPFHTLLSHILLTIATVYVVTSSDSLLGKGVVLFLSLRYLYLLFSEFFRTKTLVSWFGQGDGTSHRYYLYLTTLVFCFATFLFIRT